MTFRELIESKVITAQEAIKKIFRSKEYAGVAFIEDDEIYIAIKTTKGALKFARSEQMNYAFQDLAREYGGGGTKTMYATHSRLGSDAYLSLGNFIDGIPKDIEDMIKNAPEAKKTRNKNDI